LVLGKLKAAVRVVLHSVGYLSRGPPTVEALSQVDLGQAYDRDQVETLGELCAPFADKLRKLTKGFEERQILTLIERHMEED
jgi:hypothetical protein